MISRILICFIYLYTRLCRQSAGRVLFFPVFVRYIDKVADIVQNGFVPFLVGKLFTTRTYPGLFYLVSGRGLSKGQVAVAWVVYLFSGDVSVFCISLPV